MSISREVDTPINFILRSRRVLDVDEGILQQEAQQRVDDAKTALVEANEMDGVAATALDGARKALRRVREGVLAFLLRLGLGLGFVMKHDEAAVSLPLSTITKT